MFSRICFFIVCVLLFKLVPAQEKGNLFSHYKLQHWDSKNGLPSDLVLNIHQSKDGFIWLTTYAGVTRFDGVNFANFNSRNVPLMKSDNTENGVLETSDTTIWIPTPTSGLLGYKNGKFTAYITNYSLSRILGILPGEQMLFSTSNHKSPYLVFDPVKKRSESLSEEQVVELYTSGKARMYNSVDKSGNYWTQVRNRMVRINNGKIYYLGEEEGLSQDGIYLRFYVDSQDRVWLTSNKGLLIWNGKKMVPYQAMSSTAFSAAYFINTLILEDKKGALWVAGSKGLAYLPKGETSFRVMPNSQEFTAENITNIIEDREGNLWFSSQDGLYKASYSKFSGYSKEEGLRNSRVSAVCVVAPGKYLVGSDGKFFWIEKGMVRPYVFKTVSHDVDYGDIIHLYIDHNKTIWASTQRGVLRITEKGESFFPTDARVSFTYEDADHQVYFGVAYRGIAILDNKDQLSYLDLPAEEFRSLFLSVFRKLKNGSWLIASFNKGLLIIDKNNKPQYFVDKNGLPLLPGIFGSYEEDDGTVWLTSQGGVHRYKDNKFSLISNRDGMPENSVFNFLPDNMGNVWLPTNQGIIRASKQQLSDYLDKKIDSLHFRMYDDGDGMRSRQCVGARQSIVAPDGRVLVLTFGGLVEIDPANLSTNSQPPPVVISKVVRDTSLVDIQRSNVFGPGNARYLFEYSALSLVAPQKTAIKFRLTGYDDNWITNVGDRKAYYTNLPAGSYTFEVIAANNDGVWNNTGAQFSFVVKPFFYETAWFFVLVAFALAGLIWLIIRWRIRIVKKQNVFLETQVAARTQDLKISNAELATQKSNLENTLTELKSTQAQLVQSEKMASLGELTAGIAHEIQNPLNFVNNFSELSRELLEEYKTQRENMNPGDQQAILNDIDENLGKINHHGKRADAIVKGMLEHSRASTGAKEPVDINALTDEYTKLSYHGLRAKDKLFEAVLETSFDEKAGILNLVSQDLGRVILNITNNAFHAVIEKKNKIADPGFRPTVTVTTARVNSSVEIRIADNGNGIPANIREKIFQPFFTTKPTGQGTGLGLSLAYDIVKAHSGSLSVESREGEGTSFIIRLPL